MRTILLEQVKTEKIAVTICLLENNVETAAIVHRLSRILNLMPFESMSKQT